VTFGPPSVKEFEATKPSAEGIANSGLHSQHSSKLHLVTLGYQYTHTHTNKHMYIPRYKNEITIDLNKKASYDNGDMKTTVSIAI
jgi:hypothetical protein